MIATRSQPQSHSDRSAIATRHRSDIAIDRPHPNPTPTPTTAICDRLPRTLRVLAIETLGTYLQQGQKLNSISNHRPRTRPCHVPAKMHTQTKHSTQEGNTMNDQTHDQPHNDPTYTAVYGNPGDSNLDPGNSTRRRPLPTTPDSPPHEHQRPDFNPTDPLDDIKAALRGSDVSIHLVWLFGLGSARRGVQVKVKSRKIGPVIVPKDGQSLAEILSMLGDFAESE